MIHRKRPVILRHHIQQLIYKYHTIWLQTKTCGSGTLIKENPHKRKDHTAESRDGLIKLFKSHQSILQSNLISMFLKLGNKYTLLILANLIKVNYVSHKHIQLLTWYLIVESNHTKKMLQPCCNFRNLSRERTFSTH